MLRERRSPRRERPRSGGRPQGGAGLDRPARSRAITRRKLERCKGKGREFQAWKQKAALGVRLSQEDCRDEALHQGNRQDGEKYRHGRTVLPAPDLSCDGLHGHLESIRPELRSNLPFPSTGKPYGPKKYPIDSKKATRDAGLSCGACQRCSPGAPPSASPTPSGPRPSVPRPGSAGGRRRLPGAGGPPPGTRPSSDPRRWCRPR